MAAYRARTREQLYVTARFALRTRVRIGLGLRVGFKVGYE